MKGVNSKFDTLVQISHFREAVPAARTLIQHVLIHDLSYPGIQFV